MRNEKLYLNNLLVQTDIARILHISGRTLSRIIKEKTGQNFSSFINEYRVREVQMLMRKPELSHLSLEALAHMAGFNSRAVFYRSFGQMEAVSPAEYRAAQG